MAHSGPSCIDRIVEGRTERSAATSKIVRQSGRKQRVVVKVILKLVLATPIQVSAALLAARAASTAVLLTTVMPAERKSASNSAGVAPCPS